MLITDIKIFVNYHEYVSNDFVLKKGTNINLLTSDIDDWSITFAGTGENSNIDERLLKVRKYLQEEKMFLANYSDGLTNFPLNDHIGKFKKSNKVASFMAAKPTQSFHIASLDEKNTVKGISSLNQLKDVWINAGYFTFRTEIFEYINPGEDLVEQPFQRLIEKKMLMAYPFEGVFLTMDTYKEKQALDDMYAKGYMPWQVWREGPRAFA